MAFYASARPSAHQHMYLGLPHKATSLKQTHSRRIISLGCKSDKSREDPEKKETDKSGSGAANESLDWGRSIPTYLQSTLNPKICDEWTDAIREAEAIAAAKKKALEQGKDPAHAEEESRAVVRISRSTSVWNRIRQEAARDIETEPILSSFLFTSILSHESFGEALAFVLSNRIADQTLLPTQLFSLFMTLERAHPEVLYGALADLQAVYDRDPACQSYSQALLYFKGYHAIQLHRFAHALWESGRQVMALLLQSRLCEVLAVDIHPGATLGCSVLLDHGTGTVIGETAVVGDGVSIMQNVTLGGTGKDVGDRHPKIANNVLIGAGASILGNITVGIGAQVAAGSLVLKPVEAHRMVAGSPAKDVGSVIGNPAASLTQWSKDVPLENKDIQGRRRAVPTLSGGAVNLYQERDYYRHVDAEKAIYANRPGEETSDIPKDWPLTAEEAVEATGGELGDTVREGPVSRQPSIDSHIKVFKREKESSKPVSATTSDEVAEQLWGNKEQTDPEFYI